MTAAINRQQNSQSSKVSREDQLLDYVARLSGKRKGRRALRLHLSLLAAHNRRDNHVQAAINAFSGLLRTFDGSIFPIGYSDIIIVLCGANVLKIDQAVQKVRFLFGEDALLAANPAEGARRFCSWFDLETEIDEFRRDAQNCVRTCQLRAATDRKKAPAAAVPQATPGATVPVKPGGAMSFVDYGNVEMMLNTVNVAAMIRRQPICAVTRTDAPQHVFDEFYVSIADLQNTPAGGRSITEDRWMFQRLTRTLDRRVLQTVTGAGSGGAGGCMSLNLNVATLLSPEFSRFDGDLRAAARGTVLIELNLLDIFSDLGAYVYARDLVQERGYRVCIDGLTHLTATFVERDKLGADMVKIYWSPDIADDPAGTQAKALTASVRDAGPARVVLCRCDDARAVRAGLDLGIAMFQSHQIDLMLKSGTTLADG